jgi:hypothetical protein
MSKYGIALLVGVMAITACETTKKPTRRNVVIMNPKRFGPATVDTFGGKTPSTTVAKPVVTEKPVNTKPKVNQEAIDKATPFWKNLIPFNTFNGKAKMQFKGMGQNHDFGANIRIKKDKVIWINISALGGLVPVARIFITPDSFLFMNNLQKEAMRMPIGQATKVLPVKADFAMLQNLLIGSALKTTGRPVSANEQGGTLSIQVEDDEIIQELTYNKAENNNLRSVQLRTKDNRTEGMIQYGNYEMVTGRNFATSRAITLSNAGEPYYLSMNFNGAEFDTNVDVPFNIPKNYTIK